MAAPTFVTASTGSTDAGGAWTHTASAPSAAGNFYLVHLLQCGTGFVASLDSVTNANNIAGTANVLTSIFAADTVTVGSPKTAGLSCWAGRAANTSAMVITGSNASTDDIYVRVYEFANVSTGTTVATVFENTIAGIASRTNSSGTGTTASDASVTTLGPDRLAFNLCGIDDNIAIGQFTGMSGGTWALPTASYNTATGTNGGIVIQTATMTNAGTIDGGTVTITSGNWGAEGLALIGTTVGVHVRNPAIHLVDPAIV